MTLSKVDFNDVPTLKINNSEAILQLENDGRVIYKGKLLTTDKEIVQGFKDFLSGVNHEKISELEEKRESLAKALIDSEVDKIRLLTILEEIDDDLLPLEGCLHGSEGKIVTKIRGKIQDVRKDLKRI